MILIGRTGTMLKCACMLLAAVLVFTSCAREKVEDVLGLREQYTLDGSGAVSGQVVFTKEAEGTRITVSITGTDPERQYTAGIYSNTAAEQGALVISLGAMPGRTGRLDTLVTQLDSGVKISYTELVNFNGHLRIMQPGEAPVLLAKADIGGNALTGQSRSYTMDSIPTAVVKGTFTLQERKNGNTLASLRLSGTSSLHTYPVYLRNGKAGTGLHEQGPVAISLGSANAATGLLQTNIAKKDDSTAIKYKDLTGYDGYITVHQKTLLDSIVVAQGNIGRNAP